MGLAGSHHALYSGIARHFRDASHCRCTGWVAVALALAVAIKPPASITDKELIKAAMQDHHAGCKKNKEKKKSYQL